MNADARFVYVNEAACRILGYSRIQLLDMAVCDVNPNFPTTIWQSHWQEIRQKGSFTFESTSRTKDGRDISVEITANYLEFNGQEYNCAIAAISLLANRQKQHCLAAKRSFSHLFESAPVGFSLYAFSMVRCWMLISSLGKYSVILCHSYWHRCDRAKSVTDFLSDPTAQQQILAANRRREKSASAKSRSANKTER
ncbi:PAS domain S-box protein [Chroococcidiopsis cubana]|uniref:PAS domain S-box protein n=1 Tax=Chroococcidiopsis cubana TaxID=171392 RepID=UPI0038FCA87C